MEYSFIFFITKLELDLIKKRLKNIINASIDKKGGDSYFSL